MAGFLNTRNGEEPIYGAGHESEKPFLTEGHDYNPRLEQRDQKLKERIRFFKFVSRFLSFLMSCVVVGMMSNTIFTYFNSQNATIGGMSPWPSNPKIWPTLMLLGVSALGLISNFVVVVAYIFSHEAANDASKISTMFSVVNMIAHIVVWGVAAGLFQQQNGQNGTQNDLWSWSCSPSADARAEAFKKLVNYDFLCKSNTGSWYVALANTGLGVITIIIYLLAMSRVRSKKKLRQVQVAGGVHVSA